VQAAVHAVVERRARRDRQQRGQDPAQAVADVHGPVGAADADVDVQGERVVALGHPLQALGDPAVVVGLDELLLAVVAERVGAGGAEDDVALGGEGDEAAPVVVLLGQRVGEVLAAPGADLDLRLDELAGDRRGEDGIAGLGGVAQLLEARDELERLRIADRELLLEADGGVGGAFEGLVRRGQVDGHAHGCEFYVR
jgi:hypothetical protein